MLDSFWNTEGRRWLTCYVSHWLLKQSRTRSSFCRRQSTLVQTPEDRIICQVDLDSPLSSFLSLLFPLLPLWTEEQHSIWWSRKYNLHLFCGRHWPDNSVNWTVGRKRFSDFLICLLNLKIFSICARSTFNYLNDQWLVTSSQQFQF